jgi:hypothetical protein
MRIVYCTNSDELGDYELEDINGYDTLIVSYEADTYDGDGYAIGINASGVYIWSLGHCSCYGPGETCDRAELLDLDDASIHSATGRAGDDEHGRAVMATYMHMYQPN